MINVLVKGQIEIIPKQKLASAINFQLNFFNLEDELVTLLLFFSTKSNFILSFFSLINYKSNI